MTGTLDLRHVVTLTDDRGTYEHAELAAPRREHGYCVDDVARVLVVTSRDPDPGPVGLDLARRSLRFLGAAQDATGQTRNRRSADGRWHGRGGVEDCWGRSVWAFGTAAVRLHDQPASTARTYFEQAAQQRSPWPRAMAFAALGAAAIADVDPRARRARDLLEDVVTMLLGLEADTPASWVWPEPRLTYANAALPEALLAAGHSLGHTGAVARGLELLGWLLERETAHDHLSVTPVGGAGPSDRSGRFDQQPIEVAALADACGRAARLTGERRWTDAVRMAGAWFDGANDAGASMWDPVTGGGFDGLQADGPNRNQGAESTLALLSTRQQVRLLDLVAR